jgi:methyltransferase family protein
MLRKLARSVRHATSLATLASHSPTKEWRWSHDVAEYYPVIPIPRWGFGRPPHPKLAEVLEQQRHQYLALIESFGAHRALLSKIQRDGDSSSLTPFWRNGWFENFDAIALVGMIAVMKPAHYVEIGCGNSTKFVRFTIENERLPTVITSLDPNPRASIDALCNTIIRKSLEDCDLTLFEKLNAGDVLFFDGSHRAFTNSDVTVFFLEVLPRLKPGVIVQIHDIFLPWDYPPHWHNRLYSEQYLLGAMMIWQKQPFKVILPNWFVFKDAKLKARVENLAKPLDCSAEGGSFWLETQ